MKVVITWSQLNLSIQTALFYNASRAAQIFNPQYNSVIRNQ